MFEKWCLVKGELRTQTRVTQSVPEGRRWLPVRKGTEERPRVETEKPDRRTQQYGVVTFYK